MAPKKFMDALDEVSSASSSDADSGSEAPEQKEAQPAAKKAKLTVEDLQAAGYKPGSSLLLNMKPPQEGGDCDWAIGNGAAHKQKEEADETYEERQKTHYAATAAVEDSAEYSAKALAYAEKLRAEKAAEKERLAAEKRLTFNQKEKRKRDAGQATRGKNYIEEEKRVARAYGVYSGFD